MRKSFVFILLVGTIVWMLAGCGANGLQKQLSMGQKYLQEGNYEQALVVFMAAIEIDVNCEAAYLGAADAYVGLQDAESALGVLETAYEKLAGNGIFEKAKRICLDYAQKLEQEGNKDAAIQWLERIMKLRNDEELSKLLEKLRKKIAGDPEAEEQGNSEPQESESEDIQELVTLYGYFEQDDWDKVKEKMRSDPYQQIVAGLKEPLRYIPDKQKGVAVYANGFCYYGDFKDSLRDGIGTWLAVDYKMEDYYDDERSYEKIIRTLDYCYQGEWKNDAPNGHGREEVEIYPDWFDPEKAQIVFKTDVKDWYYHGKVQQIVSSDRKIMIFNYTAKDGVYDILEYDDLGRAIAAQAIVQDENGNLMNIYCENPWTDTKHYILGMPGT